MERDYQVAGYSGGVERWTLPESDPTDRAKALEYVAHHAAKGEVGTGPPCDQ
jgi:hypothetical protein